jgi:hypothetical protein
MPVEPETETDEETAAAEEEEEEEAEVANDKEVEVEKEERRKARTSDYADSSTETRHRSDIRLSMVGFTSLIEATRQSRAVCVLRTAMTESGYQAIMGHFIAQVIGFGRKKTRSNTSAVRGLVDHNRAQGPSSIGRSAWPWETLVGMSAMAVTTSDGVVGSGSMRGIEIDKGK